jgi:hypothetical protein
LLFPLGQLFDRSHERRSKSFVAQYLGRVTAFVRDVSLQIVLIVVTAAQIIEIE